MVFKALQNWIFDRSGIANSSDKQTPSYWRKSSVFSLGVAFCLSIVGAVVNAEQITLDIFATYEGVETNAGTVAYDTDLYVGDPGGQEFYQLIDFTFISPYSGITYTIDEANAVNGVASYGVTNVLADASDSVVAILGFKDSETSQYLIFSPYHDPITGEVKWYEPYLNYPQGTYELRTQQTTISPFQCYAADLSDDVKFEERYVELLDQFGISEPIVKSPRFLCNPVSVNGDQLFNEDTHLVCYVLAKDLKLDSDIEVYTVDSFGDLLMEVGNSRFLCLPATKEIVDAESE